MSFEAILFVMIILALLVVLSTAGFFVYCYDLYEYKKRVKRCNRVRKYLNKVKASQFRDLK